MPNNIISKIICRLIFWSALLLTGCSSIIKLTPTEIMNPPNETSIIIFNPTLTIKPISETQEILERTITQTPSPSKQPSSTPLPTLSADNAQREIDRLFRTNDDCYGVCLWGIKPGITKFDQAVQDLERLSNRGEIIIDSNKRYYQAIFHSENEYLDIGIALSEDDGIVSTINAGLYGMDTQRVTGNDWLAFRADQILLRNGTPQMIKIVMGEGPEGRISYGMAFLYDNMVIMYNGNQIIIKPEHILRACPLNDQNIQSVDINLGENDSKDWRGWLDIEEMSTLTPADVFEILVGDPEKACFDLDYLRSWNSIQN